MMNLKKNQKGVTLVALTIAIIIMLIITATIIYNVSTSNKVKALNSMYQDIIKLKDKVDLYYSSYHTIPILELKYENVNKIQNKNPNDNNVYYVIDIEALGNISLTYGKDYKTYKTNPLASLTDLYIVNERSHSIYYVRGVAFDEVTYYTIPEENTKVELSEILELRLIEEYNNMASVSIQAVDKMNGIKTITLMINDEPYKTYEYDRDYREIKREVEYIQRDKLSKIENIAYFQIEDENGIVKKSNSIIIEKSQVLVEQVQIGDYVNYDPTKEVIDKNLLTYISKIGTGMSSGNGSSEQTFTATNSIKWRVLSKNEKTGEIILISEEPLETDTQTVFSLRGTIGYLYAEQELNAICSIFGYGKGANTAKEFTYKTGYLEDELVEKVIKGSGARSINVEDINEITGYIEPQGNTYSHNVYCPTNKTTTGVPNSSVEITETHTAYYYVAPTDLLNRSSVLYQMLFRNIENTDNIHYFLASRCVNSEPSSAAYDIRNVNNQDVGSSWVVRGSTSSLSEETRAMGVRPIVYLKPNILTKGQDENNVWIIEE